MGQLIDVDIIGVIDLGICTTPPAGPTRPWT